MFNFTKRLGLTFACLASAMLATAEAQAYEIVSIDNGGVITGTIELDGPAPDPTRFKVEKTPEVCGPDDRLVEEVRVRDGHLADVVVLLEEVAAGKPYPREEAQGGPPEGMFHSQIAGGGNEFPGTTIKPKTCIFGPYTGVVAQGKFMNFRNQDPTKHSPHTYASRGRVKNTMHNEDLAADGALDLEVLFDKDSTKVVKLECDQHDHMQNWFRRVENPYYTFSDLDGSFRIDQVPPGTYTLIAWHPKFRREQKQEITVTENGEATADFSFMMRVRKPAAQAPAQ